MINYEYLHYWFYNSGMTIMDLNQAKKTDIFNKMNKSFSRRTSRMFINGKTQEAEEIMELLTSSKAAEKRKEVFDSQSVSNSSRDSGFGGKTYGSLNKMNAAEINAFIGKEANEIANGIALFQNKLSEFIQQAYNQLCSGPSWEQYQEAVIAEYLDKHGVGLNESELKQNIIRQIMQVDGMKQLKLTTAGSSGENAGPLNTSLRNLTLLAWALPELKEGQSYKWNTGGNKKLKSANSVSEVIRVLSGKISGMFSNVKGTGGELALAVAEVKGTGEVLKGINEAIDTSAVATGASVRRNYDTKTNELQEIKVSKEDVHVTISKNGVVIIEYGINAKQYTPPKSTTAYGHVSLVTDTPFLEAAHKANLSDYYLFNLAAAHGTRSKKYPNSTNEDLNEGWKNLVDYVVLKNFLDIIAGQGLNAGDNILFFVVNGKTFTIEEVINRLQTNNGMNLTNRLNYSKQNLSRSALMAKNIWRNGDGSNRAGTNKDVDAAHARSSEAWAQVYNILNATKLSVNMNILGSLMT